MCEFIMPANLKVCPNCGFVFEREPAALVQDSKLMEITEQFSKLLGKRLSELTPNELATYANFKNKKSFAQRIAKALDEGEPGYLEGYAKAMGYKDSWVGFIRNTREVDKETGEPVKTQFQDFILK